MLSRKKTYKKSGKARVTIRSPVYLNDIPARRDIVKYGLQVRSRLSKTKKQQKEPRFPPIANDKEMPPIVSLCLSTINKRQGDRFVKSLMDGFNKAIGKRE